jgi:uncharacterized RDD family membrane protein YckC
MVLKREYQLVIILAFIAMLASAWIVINDPTMLRTGEIYFILTIFGLLIVVFWNQVFGKY